MTPPDRDRIAAIEDSLANEEVSGPLPIFEDLRWLLTTLEHADAALLRLHTAVRAISEDLTLEGYAIQRALKAVLHQDHEEKDLARVDGETQASTDRISRVQQHGEQ